jgi:transposase
VKIENIDIQAAIDNAKKLVQQDKSLSPSVEAVINLLLMIITLLVNQKNLNSKNSSIPPSSDPNRKKKDKRKKKGKKPGGQNGHKGTTLEPVDKPDKVLSLPLDRSELPPGNYRFIGVEKRQVIDLEISQKIIEYQAEIYEDDSGKRYVAPFPDGVERHVQYGNGLKAHAIYLSQYQLIPYERVCELFRDQAGIIVSPGSIFNFNKETYTALEIFDAIVKDRLLQSYLCHADETGINMNGKRFWLHCLSNEKYTLFYPHEKRGGEAMDAMEVLPQFQNILCHDHWKPYFNYNCLHALCNAHHLRELERAWEQDGQQWARQMQQLLLETKKSVDENAGSLPSDLSKTFRMRFRDIIESGHKECPPPDDSKRKKGQRGRLKRSKARNLLERLESFETETLRFMDDPQVPFTNNQGENDIRMTKVHQKISGCFRSMKGAEIFCRIRSYLSTCKKNDVHASDALRLLFKGELPPFLTTN